MKEEKKSVRGINGRRTIMVFPPIRNQDRAYVCRRQVGCTGEIHGGSIERYHNENDGYTLHERKGMDKLGNVRLEHCGQDQACGGDHSTRSRLKQIS
jgi:hypothetical protein